MAQPTGSCWASIEQWIPRLSFPADCHGCMWGPISSVPGLCWPIDWMAYDFPFEAWSCHLYGADLHLQDFVSHIWLTGRVEQWWRIHIHVACIPEFPRDMGSASSPVFSCLSSIQWQSWAGCQVSQTDHLWQHRCFWFVGHRQSSTSSVAVQEHANSRDRPFSSAAFTASSFAGFRPCSTLSVSTTPWVVEGFSPPWNSPCQEECKVDRRLW